MVSTDKPQEIMAVEIEDISSLLHDELRTINESWAIPILFLLDKEGLVRFSRIKRLLNGIGNRSLSRTLKALVSDNMIERKIVDSNPPAVYYSLSAKGRGLIPLLIDLFEWNNKWNQP
jgi:DNA-binding HxlR family transcriptional regulator